MEFWERTLAKMIDALLSTISHYLWNNRLYIDIEIKQAIDYPLSVILMILMIICELKRRNAGHSCVRMARYN